MSTTQTTRLRFNELLGLPLATVVALEGEIAAVFTPLEMTLSSAIATATVHSTAYKQAQEALATADAAVLAASSEFTPVAEYEKTLYEQQRAQINLAKAEQKLYFDVRSALITVQQRESTVELRQRELSVAQTNLKAAEVQFKAGAMSSETLQERTDALRAAQDAVTSAIWDHTSARRDFLNLIGTPEPVLQVLTDEK